MARRGPDQPAAVDFDAIREWRKTAAPGDFFWAADHQVFWFLCPCGSGELTSIMVTEPREEDLPGFWRWNGDLDRPTLAPSVLRRTACGWHGFLEDGNWRQV